MIMHVAEAGEECGRVVLQLTSSHPNPVALEAAMRVAQAFRSEIESLFVEDAKIFDVASFPFAREISFAGRVTRKLSADEMARQMRQAAAGLSRRLDQMARAAEVPMHHRVVRDEPVRALASACADCGPWNVVALSNPVSPGDSGLLRSLFEMVAGTTGLVLVGPKAKRTSGPIAVAIEEEEQLGSMLRAAQRLLPVTGGAGIMIVLVSEDEQRRALMEAQARLALGDEPNVELARQEGSHSTQAALAEMLRRLKPGFVIGQYGGVLVPREGDFRHLATALECPLFLVR